MIAGAEDDRAKVQGAAAALHVYRNSKPYTVHPMSKPYTVHPIVLTRNSKPYTVHPIGAEDDRARVQGAAAAPAPGHRLLRGLLRPQEPPGSSSSSLLLSLQFLQGP